MKLKCQACGGVVAISMLVLTASCGTQVPPGGVIAKASVRYDPCLWVDNEYTVSVWIEYRCPCPVFGGKMVWMHFICSDGWETEEWLGNTNYDGHPHLRDWYDMQAAASGFTFP